jgi:hypothetical protein
MLRSAEVYNLYPLPSPEAVEMSVDQIKEAINCHIINFGIPVEKERCLRDSPIWLKQVSDIASQAVSFLAPRHLEYLASQAEKTGL